MSQTVSVYALFHKRQGINQVYVNWTRDGRNAYPKERAERIFEVKLRDSRYELRRVGHIPFNTGVMLI